MILFTGGGAVYEAFKKLEDCSCCSLRRERDEAVASAVASASVVVHNAASIQCESVEQALVDNFIPTLRIAGICLQHNPGVHFIYLGSMSYLESPGKPLPLEQMSPYAYSKYLGETYCLKSSLTRVHSVRFSTLFYEDPTRDGLSFLVAEAVRRRAVTTFNGGSAKRDFLPLDIAAAYLRELIQHPPQQKTINIAANRESAFSEVVAFLKRQLPDLEVRDKAFSGENRVLSDFSDPSLQLSRRIPFSLEERILQYMERVEERI